MKTIQLRRELPSVKTIVVKCGSRILVAGDSGPRLERLVADLAALHGSGIRVTLVTSGAIAHGMKALGLDRRPETIPLQQACASVGQGRLMARYQSYFEKHRILTGQVLLTWDDLRSKKRYLNLRNTMFSLLDGRVIPIINENDSVGTEEIKFGTNDILGAQIALLVQADLLVNLTDVAGLYTADPREDPAARRVPVVSTPLETPQRTATARSGEFGVGGMDSKLKAAEMVTRAGIVCLIGDGLDHSLADVLSDESCATLFLPAQRKMSSRHRWIAFSGSPQGTVTVDEGARKAIVEKGKSLLPAGVKSVQGSFKAGDNVDIRSMEGTVFGRGLVNFSADEIRRIAGCRSSEIETRLGGREFDEVIHRDNLATL